MESDIDRPGRIDTGFWATRSLVDNVALGFINLRPLGLIRALIDPSSWLSLSIGYLSPYIWRTGISIHPLSKSIYSEAVHNGPRQWSKTICNR